MKVMKVLTLLVSLLIGANGELLCTDDDLNTNFEENNTYPTNWNNTVGDGTSTLVIVPGIEGGNALNVTHRDRWWSSARLDLYPSCYTEGEELTFTGKIKLMDNDLNPTECTPGQLWGRFGETWVCPMMTLRITNVDGEVSYSDLGSIVPPYSPDWNNMYGTYIVTSEFLEAASVSLMWYKADKNMWFTLDEIKIDRVTDGCETLIKNGGGEAGDTRGWTYYGNDGVATLIESDDSFTIGDYHFITVNRTAFDDGMSTNIDPGCLDLDSLYEVSAKVKLRYENTTWASCDYLGTSTSGSDEPRCPMVHIGARNPGGPRQYRPVASMDSPFEMDGWNELSSVFGFFSNELTADELFLFISGSPPGTDIYIEDVNLVRVASNSHAPSAAPSTETPLPSMGPSAEASAEPSAKASAEPSAEPSAKASAEPSAAPTTFAAQG